MGSAQEYPGTSPPPRRLGADELSFLGGPPLLPSPALLDAQSWAAEDRLRSCKLLGQRGKGLGGVGSRNSVGGACMSEAADLWKELGQHATTTMCKSIAAGHFSTPSGKDTERTLSKIVRVSERRWPTLSISDCVFFCRGSGVFRTGPPGIHAIVLGP